MTSEVCKIVENYLNGRITQEQAEELLRALGWGLAGAVEYYRHHKA